MTLQPNVLNKNHSSVNYLMRITETESNFKLGLQMMFYLVRGRVLLHQRQWQHFWEDFLSELSAASVFTLFPLSFVSCCRAACLALLSCPGAVCSTAGQPGNTLIFISGVTVHMDVLNRWVCTLAYHFGISFEISKVLSILIFLVAIFLFKCITRVI